MSLKLINSYLLVAKNKQKEQKYDEAIADYNQALTYISKFAHLLHYQTDHLGILLPLGNDKDKTKEVSSLYKFSILRAAGAAECWLARGNEDDLKRAKLVFEYLLKLNDPTIHEWIELDNTSIKFLLIKTLHALGSHQAALNMMSTMPPQNYTEYHMLRADILTKISKFDDAFEIYNDLHEKESKDPIKDKILRSKKKIIAEMCKQGETVTFVVPVENAGQKSQHQVSDKFEGMEHEFASKKVALKEIKKTLNQNANLKHLNIMVINPSEYKKTRKKGEKLDRVNLEAPKIDFIENVLEIVNNNGSLQTLSFNGHRRWYKHYNYHGHQGFGKNDATTVSDIILTKLSDNNSLFQIEFPLKGLQNSMLSIQGFKQNRTQIVELCNRNFTNQVWKQRIYPAFVLLTFGMQVKPNQNWDPFVRLMLEFVGDPSQELIDKFVREPLVKKGPREYGGNNNCRFNPEKQLQPPVKKSKSKKDKSGKEEKQVAMEDDDKQPTRPGDYQLQLMSSLPENDIKKAKKGMIYLSDEYDLELMSSLKNNNNAASGKIYLSNDGKYVVRDSKGKVQEGSFDRNLIKDELVDSLKDKQFVRNILEITSKAGHTLSDEGRYVVRDSNGIVQEGSFNLNLFNGNLADNLKNKDFLIKILRTISKAGHKIIFVLYPFTSANWNENYFKNNGNSRWKLNFSTRSINHCLALEAQELKAKDNQASSSNSESKMELESSSNSNSSQHQVGFLAFPRAANGESLPKRAKVSASQSSSSHSESKSDSAGKFRPQQDFSKEALQEPMSDDALYEDDFSDNEYGIGAGFSLQ